MDPNLVFPDLITIQGYVTLLKDIITGLSALTATIIAIIGLKTWQNQIEGKAGFELAQKFLQSTYKVRNAFSFVRAPYETSEEIVRAEENVRNFKYTEEEKQSRQYYFKIAIYNYRRENLHDRLIELDSIALEAESLGIKEINGFTTQLHELAFELYKTIDRYLDNLIKPYDAKLFFELQPIMNAITDGSGPDSFARRIEEIIQEIEKIVKPKLFLKN